MTLTWPGFRNRNANANGAMDLPSTSAAESAVMKNESSPKQAALPADGGSVGVPHSSACSSADCGSLPLPALCSILSLRLIEAMKPRPLVPAPARNADGDGKLSLEKPHWAVMSFRARRRCCCSCRDDSRNSSSFGWWCSIDDAADAAEAAAAAVAADTVQ